MDKRVSARKVVVGVVGGAIVVLGLVMIPLPGPGTAVVVAGVWLLSTEFAWAAGARALVRSLWARVRPRAAA